MNPGISILITEDTTTPQLQRWMNELGAERLAARIGPPLQQLTMEHLAALGPNRKGYPTTRFYEKFARNVRWIPHPKGVAIAVLPVVINGRLVGLAQRVFGGVIKPVSVSMLAISISPVSYGKVPADFPNLFLLPTPKGAYLVQRGTEISAKTGNVVGRSRLGGNAGRRLRAELNFLFKLVSSVTQEGNREVLPSDEELLQIALDSAAGGLN